MVLTRPYNLFKVLRLFVVVKSVAFYSIEKGSVLHIGYQNVALFLIRVCYNSKDDYEHN